MATGASPTFGEVLKRYRAAAGLSQEALAERAGVSVRAISDLERGLKTRPHRATIALLTAALHLSAPERAALEDAARAPGRPAAVPSHANRSAPPAVLPPFVGRSRELVLLERHLANEGPPLLVLAGEPGIGKSRLLHEAAQRALAQGLSVLQGGCQRRGGQEPYAPLLQAVEGHVRAQAPTQLRAELHGCAWLVRLLPELADGPIEPLPAWTLPPAQERRLLFQAVGCYLANVAGPGGTLLLLDDLQWAGADALDLLVALVRAAAPTGSGLAGPLLPLRVLGAYRDSEVTAEHALSGALADLAQAGLAAQPGSPRSAGCGPSVRQPAGRRGKRAPAAGAGVAAHGGRALLPGELRPGAAHPGRRGRG